MASKIPSKTQQNPQQTNIEKKIQSKKQKQKKVIKMHDSSRSTLQHTNMQSHIVAMHRLSHPRGPYRHSSESVGFEQCQGMSRVPIINILLKEKKKDETYFSGVNATK